MTNEEKLKRIEEWANSSHSYLRHGGPHSYGMGYYNGISRAKEIVLELMHDDID